MRRLKPHERPAALQRPEIRGVFVGGCVKTGKRLSYLAHAHMERGDGRRGWVCFRSWRTLGNPQVVLHELAHILSGERHTATFRDLLKSIGGILDESCFDARHRAAMRAILD